MNNGWLARALFGQKRSLAEHVYAEFERRGINVSISGYHGTGVFMYQSMVNQQRIYAPQLCLQHLNIL